MPNDDQAIDDANGYEVELVIGKRFQNGWVSCWVRWVGYGPKCGDIFNVADADARVDHDTHLFSDFSKMYKMTAKKDSFQNFKRASQICRAYINNSRLFSLSIVRLQIVSHSIGSSRLAPHLET